MNRVDFENLLLQLQRNELDIDRTKGREYVQDDEDVLDNFKRAGEWMGTTPLLTCLVYMYKHFSAIASYARQECEMSDEKIQGRVQDLRLYAALFLALARDGRGDKLDEILLARIRGEA